MPSPLPEGFAPPTPAGVIEVKDYPAYRSATVRFQGNLAQATSAAFNPLFQHITSNNISMTSPVEARYLADESSSATGEAKVSFLYRSSAVTPAQVAAGVEVEDHPPMCVVSIGIQGTYDWEHYRHHVEQLRAWLSQHPEYEAFGSPRRFLYDSPFIPDPQKRSEVQIPVRRTAS